MDSQYTHAEKAACAEREVSLMEEIAADYRAADQLLNDLATS